MDFNIIIILLAIGLVSGILGGMVGIGGGIIIVPALIYLLGFTQYQAQGTSLALLMLPVGVLGVIQYYKQGHIDFSVVFILAAAFVVGSFFGSKLAMSIPQETVKKIFACLLLFVGIKMLFFDGKKNKVAPKPHEKAIAVAQTKGHP